MSNPNKRIKLSFEDEEEDEVNIFSKKKVNAKPSKRIFQAPVIEDNNASNLSLTETRSHDKPGKPVSALVEATKTTYSKADLDALRTAQNFKTANPQPPSISQASENEPMDVVELSGDQADALEEQLYGKQSTSLDGSVEMKRYEALIAEKKQQKNHLRINQGNNSTEERIYTSNLVPKNENKRVAFDISLDLEPNEWEEEIIQRGVLLPSAQPREEDLSAARLGFATSKNIKNNSTQINDIMIMDLIQQVQANIDQLQFNLDEYDRKSNQLTTEVQVAETKAQEQERIAEENFQRLHAIEEAKRFFPNVIGMLREKEPFFQEVLTVWRDCLQRQHNQRHISLAHYQEDIIYRLQQAKELQTMDSSYRFSPNSICQNNTENETDSFGREKPLAVIDDKAYFTKPEVVSARSGKLTKALQKHIYLSELDTISSDALQKQRWEIIAQMHLQNNNNTKSNNNVSSLYLDALLHCLQPLDWEMKWQQEVTQVEAAMQTLMADVAYEVSSVKEILRYAAHVRSRVTDAYYQAYIPLSIGQVLPFLTILEVLPHTYLFYHPREVLGTHDMREETLELQQGAMSSWRWVHIVKDFLLSSPTHVMMSQTNPKNIIPMTNKATSNNTTAVTRQTFLHDTCVEDDHNIVQQLLDNDGLLWRTYFASFFTYALDLSCPRSCLHAQRHVCGTLLNVFLPEITSIVSGNNSDHNVHLGSWGVFVQSVQEKVSLLLCERLTAQCLEIALPVCHVNDKLYSLVLAIEAATHNLSNRKDTHYLDRIDTNSVHDMCLIPVASTNINNITPAPVDDKNDSTRTHTNNDIDSGNSKEQKVGASNFKGGRMMFVSASSANSSIALPTSTANTSHTIPSASHNTTSHHRMGLGYSSTIESAKNTISMDELLENDVGLGVSFMSMQVLHITQILRHFHDYFLSSFVLFLPNHDMGNMHRTKVNKRAMHVRQTLQVCIWQRIEPVLRKLVRVSLYPILDIVLNEFLTRFVSTLAVLLPWCAEQESVNVVAWQRCQQSMEEILPLAKTIAHNNNNCNGNSNSRQWKEMGDMLILLIDDLSSVML